ncbi:undecaprenyl-diphosphate phosphatase [Georgenia ruanii]|uniref:undecaprenyl-diphosphate phosphatase n=1 Tax=Georgenia ruanii TaxID=348442 RepID=UPI0012644BE7|nr:undecaprenyl-diphosphate phosphatase [Georgenia ruanii]
MTWLEAVILGLVQGLTEFLPISSSAHLRIVGDLMGADPGAAFTAITQIGTEAAVVLYFRRDIVRIIKAWFGALPVGPWKNTVPTSNPDARMGWFVIVGSVPIVVLGVLFQNAIDTTFRNLWITVVTLSVFAVLLGIADATSRRTKLLEHMTWRDAVLFGFAQALALIPGVSRSGGTITAGLLMGYTREAAARYSFLLAIPAVLGSGFYKLFTDGLEGGVDPGPTLLATLVAFVVGYVVIIWFLKLVSTRSYLPFVIYRLALAAVVVVLLLTGVVEATSAVVTPAG